MAVNRRDFLKGAGALGAAAALPWHLASDAGAAAADLTTLGRTIILGQVLKSGSVGDYRRLTWGAGEPHILRTELATRTARPRRKSLFSFAHLTDIHLVDAQSPARVEFLDRFSDRGMGCEAIPFDAAFRPHETISLHVLEAMIRRVRAIRVSPITRAPIRMAICTGDNIDNQQFNELRWFIDIMDGGKTITPNSGNEVYEGVQSTEWGDVEYWHPDAEVPDKFKQQYGFPDYPGMLESVVTPFRAAGVGMPWLQTYGNHDGLLQGNAPRNPVFEGIATGSVKYRGLAPGINPCDAFQTMRDNPAAFLAAPAAQVTADPNRRVVTRAEYAEELFKTTGTPVGHGFTQFNKDEGVAYWFNDSVPGFRIIGLDTVNPGGFSEGSIGQTQFNWLEERLTESTARYVILVSHHGLRSLDNPVITPDPAEPAAADMPRVMADEIEPLIHRFPNVIAWVNGHTHENIVQLRQNESGGGFWDIGTAAHIDFSCQSRLIDVVDNGEGTLSIFCTMIDHAAPVVPSGKDPVLRLAAISRELAANDYQFGYAGKGPGEVEDRNVELVIPARKTS